MPVTAMLIEATLELGHILQGGRWSRSGCRQFIDSKFDYDPSDHVNVETECLPVHQVKWLSWCDGGTPAPSPNPEAGMRPTLCLRKPEQLKLKDFKLKDRKSNEALSKSTAERA